MSNFMLSLLLFFLKALIVVILVLLLPILLFALLSKNNHPSSKGRLIVKNLNQHYDEMSDILHEAILPKKLFKKIIKKRKTLENKKRIFVLHFQGDIKATAVAHLRQEITVILLVATPKDEVVLKLYSAGGTIHGYGLAAAQLIRLRQRHIPLTIIIDKVAASGGYMMACVANKILAAPFAIIGSIGVIVQLPNFHRFLQDKKIDFEQLTAGQYKRTLTLFGENTTEQREKLKQELTDMHEHFKQLILEYRPQMTIDQVATGEHWIGQQALSLQLIDAIKTSDEYLLEKSMEASLYAVSYSIKKSLSTRLTSSIGKLYQKVLAKFYHPQHNLI